MTDATSWDESVNDVEAMIRAAGGYVGASDDLRPRVLEAAQQQTGERSMRRRLRSVALVVVFLAVVSTEFRQHLEKRSAFDGPLGAVQMDVMNSMTPATAREGDGDWRMIDAFTRLKQQQARLLGFEI